VHDGEIDANIEEDGDLLIYPILRFISMDLLF